MRSDMNLDDIVAKLNERKKRATYGAVAGILGVIPRAVMSGRPRNYENSWVVAKTGPRRGRPTNYADMQIHPDCLYQIRADRDSVIRDSEALKRWLKSVAGEGVLGGEVSAVHKLT
jgi:hypothetical protein